MKGITTCHFVTNNVIWLAHYAKFALKWLLDLCGVRSLSDFARSAFDRQ